MKKTNYYSGFLAAVGLVILAVPFLVRGYAGPGSHECATCKNSSGGQSDSRQDQTSRFKNLPWVTFRRPNLMEIFSLFKHYSGLRRPGLGDLATPIDSTSLFSLFVKRLWNPFPTEEKQSKKSAPRFFKAPYLNGN